VSRRKAPRQSPAPNSPVGCTPCGGGYSDLHAPIPPAKAAGPNRMAFLFGKNSLIDRRCRFDVWFFEFQVLVQVSVCGRGNASPLPHTLRFCDNTAVGATHRVARFLVEETQIRRASVLEKIADFRPLPQSDGSACIATKYVSANAKHRRREMRHLRRAVRNSSSVRFAAGRNVCPTSTHP
jgi:hypothetical protein